MNRLHQIILIASTVLGSWVGMQAIHEAGHVLGAMGSGGRVARVVLHPLTVSRTDLAANPHPMIVAWSGPVVGAATPLMIWAIADALRARGAFVLRFFAGFCLIANGAYLGIGWIGRVGDAGELVRLGSPAWALGLFGLACVPAGFWLWHRQGGHFGLGAEGGRVDPGVAWASLVACVSLIVLGLAVG